MKNILVAVDFSDKSLAILQHLTDWVVPDQAKVWIMHVATPDPKYISFGSKGSGIEDYAGFKLKTANQELQALVQHLKNKGYHSEGLLIKGKPTESILSEAAEIKVDVIVMGDRGYGKLHDFVVGSVCQEVVRRSPIPVWVVPVRPQK